jgi:hypothetical protein
MYILMCNTIVQVHMCKTLFITENLNKDMFMFGSAGGKISADNLGQVCLSGVARAGE